MGNHPDARLGAGEGHFGVEYGGQPCLVRQCGFFQDGVGAQANGYCARGAAGPGRLADGVRVVGAVPQVALARPQLT
ncbi:hypothetical protein ABT173_05505 [Streptomyces sp. NPDC001795]|uniref:hypothetical protein n=1 Tax=Streptomyces sp. NPDC001795 TaxID=3154525 RepID=UPI003328D2D9